MSYKYCIICHKEIPETRLAQGKFTCCRGCQIKYRLNLPEIKEKRKNSIKEAYNKNPELRRQASERNKINMSRPDVKEKISISVKNAMPKIIETKRKNGTFTTSKPEKYIKQLLENKFSKVHYQYKSNLYPYNCDFYIEDIDLYIEYNGNWTHGFMPYIKDDEKCKQQLSKWLEKACYSKYWQTAVTVWTKSDVEKLQTFKRNNLNYKIFYNYIDFKEWYDTIK